MPTDAPRETPRGPASRVLPPLIIHASEAMAAVLDLALKASATDVKVLITGESGVGKDLVARYIHSHSSRAAHPYVAINCAGLSETLLESELFGHTRGSFTDAHRDSPGKLRMANEGTLFLDELGEMSLRMQALLLRFLESGEIQPVGADEPSPTLDVRVIGATNRNPAELVAAGTFREDLLYRLRVVHIHIPPLRERPDDVWALVDFLVSNGPRRLTFTASARQALERYRWPGNVRELQNLVQLLLALRAGHEVDLPDLPQSIRGGAQRVAPVPERRRQVADDLYEALTGGRCSFWEHVYPLFMHRDLTRHDLRALVQKGLATTHGHYQALMRLFGVPAGDYKRFMNFLSAHDCTVDYRMYRHGGTPPQERAPQLPVPDDAGQLGG